MTLTGVDYDICMTQSRIYRYAAQKGFDMKRFSEAFLCSDFCKRAFDTIYSRFQVADVLECMDFVEPEIEKDMGPSEDGFFDEDVAAWIGFTYRQLYMETGICSADLSKKVGFEVMCGYYPGLHTIAVEEASQIICRNHSLMYEKENVF